MNRVILMILVFCAGSVLAQDNASEGTARDEQKIDQLFDQIMLTFPQELKEKIDSTSKCAKVKSTQQEFRKENQNRSMVQTQQNLINDLPKELRGQVEKTISDIEKRRNERALQFREYKKE